MNKRENGRLQIPLVSFFISYLAMEIKVPQEQ
jgi:hypothetical protein